MSTGLVGLRVSFEPDYSVQPKPLPVPAGVESAHELVVADLALRFSGSAVQSAIDVIRERAEFGLRKYGTPLHAVNGRNYPLDVQEELLDLVAYFRIYLEKRPELVPLLASDYQALLQFLVRWRSMYASLQEPETSA